MTGTQLGPEAQLYTDTRMQEHKDVRTHRQAEVLHQAVLSSYYVPNIVLLVTFSLRGNMCVCVCAHTHTGMHTYTQG